jgi:hypothetical protein
MSNASGSSIYSNPLINRTLEELAEWFQHLEIEFNKPEGTHCFSFSLYLTITKHTFQNALNSSKLSNQLKNRSAKTHYILNLPNPTTSQHAGPQTRRQTLPREMQENYQSRQPYLLPRNRQCCHRLLSKRKRSLWVKQLTILLH